MKKRRLIPVLLLKNGLLVQSRQFRRHQILGNPTAAVRRISEWASDELIYLDVSRDDTYENNREDQKFENRQNFFEIIKDVAQKAFMPITVGGKIRSLVDIQDRLALGADKVAVNTQALVERGFISRAAREFGSQCIVVSVDVKMVDGRAIVFANRGSNPTRYTAQEWCHIVEQSGAGEILLNSIDRDGAKVGYDIDLLSEISENIKIPLIACGGVGEWRHFAEALQRTKVDAVAAANIFHYVDQSVFLAKKYLYERDFNVRKPTLIQI